MFPSSLSSRIRRSVPSSASEAKRTNGSWLNCSSGRRLGSSTATTFHRLGAPSATTSRSGRQRVRTREGFFSRKGCTLDTFVTRKRTTAPSTPTPARDSWSSQPVIIPLSLSRKFTGTTCTWSPARAPSNRTAPSPGPTRSRSGMPRTPPVRTSSSNGGCRTGSPKSSTMAMEHSIASLWNSLPRCAPGIASTTRTGARRTISFVWASPRVPATTKPMSLKKLSPRRSRRARTQSQWRAGVVRTTLSSR
mmetsp:Transcript_23537/g.69692  ORF Transcript_23537/g.69692 Transcript_23537/m.69692 type:complete len:249 (+) Transcript_23537:742-1488(+)